MEKYTDAAMPKVHDAYPLVHFELLSNKVIDEWDTFPGLKLAAIPFGTKTRDTFSYNSIRQSIFSAVQEITKAEKLGVSAPEPNSHAARMRESPITFLISDLSEHEQLTLLRRGVWSSTTITFRVFPLTLSRPDFLFTIEDLSITVKEDVLEVIMNIWQDDQAQTFFQLLPQDMSTDDQPPPRCGHQRLHRLRIYHTPRCQD
jgi:hypothetical protein